MRGCRREGGCCPAGGWSILGDGGHRQLPGEPLGRAQECDRLLRWFRHVQRLGRLLGVQGGEGLSPGAPSKVPTCPVRARAPTPPQESLLAWGDQSLILQVGKLRLTGRGGGGGCPSHPAGPWLSRMSWNWLPWRPRPG